MDPSTFLIVGANGQLGRALREKYPEAKSLDSGQLDISNAQAVNDFEWAGITTILNAAAYTNVDGSETAEGKTAAWAVNADGAAHLAKIAKERDLVLVHVSTEYVFDGTKDLHDEDEPMNPLSEYGKSKAAGDEHAAGAPKHYIIRTSWVIGDGKNFVRTMLSLAEKGVSPSVVNDQIGRLTFTEELVRAIAHLLSTHAPYGTYNVSNGGESASWADVTREIFKDTGHADLEVTNISTDQYFSDKPHAAKRPLKSTLSLKKIEATGFHPVDWRDNLKKYVEKELNS